MRCCSLFRPDPQRVADGQGQLGTVQRVKVKLLDSLGLQPLHLLDRNVRRNDTA